MHLREVRNLTVPISRLPPEILVAIFKYHCPDRESPPNPLSGHPPPFSDASHVKPWFQRMTHVCRHWRNIALGTPSLWNSIIFGSHDLLDETSLPYTSLRRAYNGPLNVTIHPGTGTEITHVYNHIVPVFERLGQLHIRRIPLAAPNTWAASLDDVSAPHLETLRIRALSPRSTMERRIFPGLPRLLGGNVPSLKNLDVCGYTDMTANTFRNLTTLRLMYQSYTSDDLSHLYSLLRASPALQRLMFNYCELRPVMVWPPPPPPAMTLLADHFICLHHLRQLTLLDCQFVFMAEVLSHLDIRQENTFILCGGVYPIERNMPTFFPSTEQSRIGPLSSIPNLHIFQDATSLLVRVNVTGPTNAIQLLFNDDVHRDRGMDIPIFSLSWTLTLPFHTVTQLKLSGTNQCAPIETWRKILHRMTELSMLTVHLKPDDPVVLAWLTGPLSALAPQWDHATGMMYIPAPKLAELCIYPPIPAACTAVVQSTKLRADHGLILKRLRIMLDADEELARPFRPIFEAWKARPEEWKEHAEEVIFEVGDGYRCQDVPEVIRPYMFQAQLDTWA